MNIWFVDSRPMEFPLSVMRDVRVLRSSTNQYAATTTWNISRPATPDVKGQDKGYDSYFYLDLIVSIATYQVSKGTCMYECQYTCIQVKLLSYSYC